MSQPHQPQPAGSTIEIWKLIISGFGVMATVGGIFYGVWTYFDQRDHQIAQRGLEIESLQRESKKKFLDLYVEAVSTVSRLTTGFSLCNRTLKGTPFKWLDLRRLFQTVLQPHHRIERIKDFTARVTGSPDDPSRPQHQDVYLRALRHHIAE